MRIHTDRLKPIDVFEAARISRVEFEQTWQGSKSRDRSVNVTLTGESNRRPNSGQRGAGYSDEYAATWDQWGVFFAVLFDRDPDMICGTAKYPVYANRDDFHYKTVDRFRSVGLVPRESPGALAVAGDEWDGTNPDMVVFRREGGYWPDDAHGDHTFRYDGVPRESRCTKCSAVRRWN